MAEVSEGATCAERMSKLVHDEVERLGTVRHDIGQRLWAIAEEAQSAEVERLRKSLTRLIRRAASMRLKNTSEWLGWFVESLNEGAKAVGSDTRFIYNKEADFICTSPTPTEASE